MMLQVFIMKVHQMTLIPLQEAGLLLPTAAEVSPEAVPVAEAAQAGKKGIRR